MIKDDESLDLPPLAQHRRQQLWGAVEPFGKLLEVVPGDEAAQRPPRPDIEQRQHRPENRATDILEIHVDALRAGRREPPWQLRLTVIEALVEPQRVERVLAFLAATGDTDCAAPLDSGELPNDRSDRADRK